MESLLQVFSAMAGEHWFWASLTVICLLWYMTITFYVAVKGIDDIRGMLDRLSKKKHLDQ